MSESRGTNQRILEIFLLVITLAIACLLTQVNGFKMIVLNLFFLPVVLAGFYLGRYRAGVLAFFCVISASVVTAFDLESFAVYSSPVVIGLAVLMWGAVLGLTALLVGTLSDERTSKISELHEAYVGVVEVLSRYLQSANPTLEARSSRVAHLSQQVALQLKLSPKEVDDVRVAALLHDIENVEITSRVIRRAMGNLEAEQLQDAQHTFPGTDLVHSLAGVLTGALPLLVDQRGSLTKPAHDDAEETHNIPRGAQIIAAVRAYQSLCDGDCGEPGIASKDAVAELRTDEHAAYDALLLDALDRVACQGVELEVPDYELVG